MIERTKTSLGHNDASDSATADLHRNFEEADQGQVFRFWDELSSSDREQLLAEAREIDLAEISRLTAGAGDDPASGDFSTLEPAPFLHLPKTKAEQQEWREAAQIGEEALRQGKVAAFTVAGGQGTRLGFDGPKGTFPVTPVTKKSLFQVFAEQIQAARKQFGAAIPWFIMTSHVNHAETEAFFRQHQFFGLPEGDVFFFRQGRMPAVDPNGKILLESKNRIAMSPDGHGGSLRALCRSGAIAMMEDRGIETISYFQVDNPLVHAIDPVFLGFHLREQSEMSSKMIAKRSPDEKVGVFAQRDGKMLVVEYSDLPAAFAEKHDDSGALLFGSGSIAIHLLAVPFVKKLGERADEGGPVLPFHRARKKIPTIDESGNPLKPSEPNGIKFEMFVFDALPFARNPLVIESRREDEFSPVKNAEGSDSPATCRDDQLRRFARWFRAAGIPLETDASGLPSIAIEVSPLFATDEAGFIQAWQSLEPKPPVQDGLVL